MKNPRHKKKRLQIEAIKTSPPKHVVLITKKCKPSIGLWFLPRTHTADTHTHSHAQT